MRRSTIALGNLLLEGEYKQEKGWRWSSLKLEDKKARSAPSAFVSY